MPTGPRGRGAFDAGGGRATGQPLPLGAAVRSIGFHGWIGLASGSIVRGGYQKRPPMAFDAQLCETVYDQLGNDKCLRRVYRAHLRQHAWQLLKHAINGEEIGLALLRDASSSGGAG
jgi:hypothetical protein